MGSLLSSALKPMPTFRLRVRDNSGERVIEVSKWEILKDCADYC